MNYWLENIKYLTPAVISLCLCLLGFYFFLISLLKTQQKISEAKSREQTYLKARFLAYERWAIFLERIKPMALALRVYQHKDELEAYRNLLIREIEQEFSHNLSQQIYINSSTWKAIVQAKLQTQQIILNLPFDSKSKANELQSSLLDLERKTPSDIVLDLLRIDIQDYIK